MIGRAVGSLFVLVMAVGITSPASAQLVEILPQIGVFGVSYSGDTVDSETGIGFEAGGKLRVGGRVYVEAGIFWATAAADVTPVGEARDNLRIQDVRIPLTLGIRLINLRLIALRVFAGAVPATVTSVSDNDLGIVKEDLKSTIWSGRAGAGLDFTLLAVDVGYDFGLSGIFDDETAPDVKRNAFFIEAGFRFGF